MDLSFIDMDRLLTDYEIEYKTSGKNTTRGWRQVCCPFCGDDPSYHLGISKINLIHCWRCGEKGSIIKYLKAELNKPYSEVMSILEDYEDMDLVREEDEGKQKRDSSLIQLPEDCKKKMPKMAESFLYKRGFDPRYVSSKYKLKFTTDSLDYPYRIIIPVYANNKLVSFTSRDYTGNAWLKYVHDKEYDSMKGKPWLYGIDRIENRALVVEGPTDQWRLGDETVCTFGIEYSMLQVMLLAKKGLEDIVVLFDDEDKAQERAKAMALDLSPYAERVRYTRISGSGKDPDEILKGYSRKRIERFKEELFNER